MSDENEQKIEKAKSTNQQINKKLKIWNNLLLLEKISNPQFFNFKQTQTITNYAIRKQNQ